MRKRFNKNDEAVSPVIAIILMVAITVVLAGVLYLWVTDLAGNQDDAVKPMAFKVYDGADYGNGVGCFFYLVAETGVDIDPAKYEYKVAHGTDSPRLLDFKDWRYYTDEHVPGGGDRNMSYRYDDEVPLTDTHTGSDPGNYEESNMRMTDTERIGFDIPTQAFGVPIVDGDDYWVYILLDGQQQWKGKFNYKAQSTPTWNL